MQLKNIDNNAIFGYTTQYLSDDYNYKNMSKLKRGKSYAIILLEIYTDDLLWRKYSPNVTGYFDQYNSAISSIYSGNPVIGYVPIIVTDTIENNVGYHEETVISSGVNTYADLVEKCEAFRAQADSFGGGISTNISRTAYKYYDNEGTIDTTTISITGLNKCKFDSNTYFTTPSNHAVTNYLHQNIGVFIPYIQSISVNNYIYNPDELPIYIIPFTKAPLFNVIRDEYDGQTYMPYTLLATWQNDSIENTLGVSELTSGYVDSNGNLRINAQDPGNDFFRLKSYADDENYNPAFGMLNGDKNKCFLLKLESKKTNTSAFTLCTKLSGVYTKGATLNSPLYTFDNLNDADIEDLCNNSELYNSSLGECVNPVNINGETYYYNPNAVIYPALFASSNAINSCTIMVTHNDFDALHDEQNNNYPVTSFYDDFGNEIVGTIGDTQQKITNIESIGDLNNPIIIINNDSGNITQEVNNITPDDLSGYNTTSNINRFYNCYECDNTILNSFSNYLWGNQQTIEDGLKLMGLNPMNGVISVMQLLLPNLANLINSNTNTTTIKIGSVDSGVNAVSVNSYTGLIYVGESINPITEFYNDFRDYEPYSELYIYLPLCGIKKIDLNQIMNSVIKLYISLSLETGNAKWLIFANNNLIDEFPFKLLEDYPITGTNRQAKLTAQYNAYNAGVNANIERIQAKAGNAQRVMDYTSNIIELARNPSVENGLATMSNFVKNESNMAINKESIERTEKNLKNAKSCIPYSGGISQTSALDIGVDKFNSSEPYLVSVRYSYSIPANYGHVIGYRSNKMITRLGDYSGSGFIKMQNPELGSNSEGMLENEKNEVINMLMKGIYI